MKNFYNLNDIKDINQSIDEILDIKNNIGKYQKIFEDKIIGLIFFNPSLRTRMSTYKASKNLGLETFFINISNNMWSLEFEDGKIMDSSKVEHIKDAARVISNYCDIIGVRSFPLLKSKEKDAEDHIIKSFIRYSNIPVFNMESSIAHPLQALTDLVTIKENSLVNKPKVLLTWAPHIKPLPHAVPNSFVRAIMKMNFDISITNPEGFNLDPTILKGIKTNNNQLDAFKGVDFVYAKNWSSFENYGEISDNNNDWIIDEKKMSITNNAKFMHCLPIRRNLVATDNVIDSEQSLIIDQSENRIYTAQHIIKKLLKNG